MMRSQLRQLLTAIQFLSRLPVSRDLNPSTEEFSGSAKYFPLVGILLGLILVSFHLGLGKLGIKPELIPILLLGLAFLLTGGFHEDGWADSLDGLGGAFDRRKKLEIMKDSRIGTYGALGLIFVALYRWQLWGSPGLQLSALLPTSFMWARFSSLVLVKMMSHVSIDSKSKPVVDALSGPSLLASSFFTVLMTLIVVPHALFIPILISFLLIILFSKWFFTKQIGGYTGDVLGAVNIVTELLIFSVGLRFWALS